MTAMLMRMREWARPDTGAEPSPLDEYIEFHQAGFPAVGRFCCVSCGNKVACVGLLRSCRVCGGDLWERPETSPWVMQP